MAIECGKRFVKKIRDAKFCILVDEAQDESKKEQMTIILRYVDCDGFVGKQFFEVVNVKETSASTLKKEIYNVLTRIIFCLKIYEDKDMMMLVICEVY